MALHQVNPAHYVIDHLPPILYTELKVGSGRVIPTEFTPPSPDDTPQSLFPHCPKLTATDRVHRFIRLNEDNRSVEDEFLIYTDATCLDNGKTNAKAGCSFVYNDSASGWARFPLEVKGPFGEQHLLTVHRAHIRAVIAALRYKDWAAEGFTHYLVEGITGQIREWIHSSWVSISGEHIKNRDLWECLLGEVEILDEKGISVQFWRIRKELNVKADRHAKHAAFMARHQQFTDLAGVTDASA
ncbi:unnamed protein product [Penicillium viridicatum]